MKKDRVIVYVDGFNLYYGLKDSGLRRYYWLDIQKLAENLLKPNQRLVAVRYFTTRLKETPASATKRKRQSTYLEALETLHDTHLYYGHYLAKDKRCSSCGAVWQTYEEKMTDVNIAVELLVDAQDDKIDTAIIVSGDSDLTRPIEVVLQRYSNTRVIIAFPPNRDHSKRLKIAATSYFTIGRKKLKDSQFPNEIKTASGFVLKRPQKWI